MLFRDLLIWSGFCFVEQNVSSSEVLITKFGLMILNEKTEFTL